MLKSCGVCNLGVDKDVTGETIFPCGHSFHIKCAHGFLSRNFSYCPKCNFDISLPLFSKTKPSEKFKNPLDFGDDSRIHVVLELRESLLNADQSSITSNRIHKNIGKTSTEENGTKNSIFNVFDVNKFTSLLRDSNSNEKNIESLKSEKNITILISHKAPVDLIIDKGYTFKALLRSGETVSNLLRLEYSLSDFVYLRASWSNLTLGNGSIDYFVFEKYRNQLSITIMTLVYKVTLSTIFTDLCYSKIENLAKMKITVDEMKLLKSDFDTLLIIDPKFNAESMIAFDHYKLNDWKNLGFSKSHESKIGKITMECAKKMGWIVNDKKIK